MKQILVVYSYASKYGHGFGNVDFSFDGNIPTINAIREIERQISEKYCLGNVVVLNIIELAEESEDTE